jgi:hypothetical protein
VFDPGFGSSGFPGLIITFAGFALGKKDESRQKKGKEDDVFSKGRHPI